MNKERLLKLASELERCSRGRVLTIPGDGKAEFDLGLVAIGSLRNGTKSPGYSCGSACCAMGFAGVHPWFKKRGLRWSPTPDAFTNTPFSINERDAGGYLDAGAQFFGVDRETARTLFNPNENNETPKQYAKRIRAFVKESA